MRFYVNGRQRICNEIADSVPELALKVFTEIKKGKYNIPINTFSRIF
jgi:hypothetical protein